MGRERVEWCGMLPRGRIIADADADAVRERRVRVGEIYCFMLRNKCEEGARCMVLNVSRTVTVYGSRAWSSVM
jgi:hypothetical protein